MPLLVERIQGLVAVQPYARCATFCGPGLSEDDLAAHRPLIGELSAKKVLATSSSLIAVIRSSCWHRALNNRPLCCLFTGRICIAARHSLFRFALLLCHTIALVLA
jgi:hypothetical protein